MKQKIAKLIFLSMMIWVGIILWTVSCQAAEEVHWNSKAQWKTSDTVLSVAAVALTVIDWSQTRHIANDPQGHKELNPILGPHPSQSSVDIYFPVTLAIGGAVAYFVPSWRPYILGGWIALETSCTFQNYNHGIAPF